MNAYTEAAAELSECGLYRWTLTRAWDSPTSGLVSFVMLNPSTADGKKDDATIRRCVGFARAWGFNRLLVVNLFPFRSTNKLALVAAPDPTAGKFGDRAVRRCLSADAIVCAWGAWVPFNRDAEVKRQLHGRRLHCLGLTNNGKPRHPLRLRGDLQPVYF